MIYTIGHYRNYEKMLVDIPNLKKAIGGSVWKTHYDALRYLTLCEIQDFEIYGVEADWEKDTQTDLSSDNQWHELLVEAKIIKL
jgi:hypothetical protein